jgi:hypothetical protein
MCKLGVREYCRGKTHGTGAGIALQPAITTAIEAAVHSSGCGKVTVSATLKNNQKEARVGARKKSGRECGQAPAVKELGRKEKKANPYAARFPVIWDRKLCGGIGGRLPSRYI